MERIRVFYHGKLITHEILSAGRFEKLADTLIKNEEA